MTSLLPGSVCKVLVTSANVDEDGSLIVWGHALKDDNDDDDTFALFHDNLQEGIQVCRKVPTAFAKNGLCAALFKEDEAWYRAKFLYKYSENEWTVQFTDYGNEEVVKVEDIAEIPKEFRSLPDQALAFIITEGLNPQHNSGTWHPNAAKALKENFLYQIVDVTITTRVADARYTGTNSEMINRLIQDKFCTRGLAYPKSLFTPGAVVPCFVSYMPHNLSVFIQPTSRKDQLKAFMQDLNDFFNVRNNRLGIDKDELQVGAIVAGIYSVDCLYYRVRVSEIYKDSCMVLFIDYGGQEKIDFVELWKLPEKFNKPDYFAVESKFSEITLNEDQGALQKICDYLLSDVLEVTATCSSNPPVPISAKINGSSVEGKFLAGGLATLNDNGKLDSLAALNNSFGSVPRISSKSSYEAEQQASKFKLAPTDAYYSPIVFNRGDHEKVVITNVESVEKISVRLQKNENKFKSFQENLKNLYPTIQENLKVFQVVDASVGDAVAIRASAENCYYRGEIIEALDGAKALVNHVDFGCKKIYNISELLLPAANFFEIPAQAITCALCRIKDLGSKAQKEILATTFLNKCYRAIFAGYQGGCHFVELYMNLGNANSKFGILTKSLLRDEPFIELPEEIKSLYVASTDTTPSKAPLRKPVNESPSKAPLRKPVNESPNELRPVENATLKRIFITHIDDPVCFWYQTPCTEDLKSLQLALNKIYDWTPEDELFIKKIEVGEKCCVKYTHDQMKAWRRGIITYHFGDCVNVRLMDYGEEVQVRKRDVKMLFEEFEKRPPYANEAKLFNIKPTSKRWEKETTLTFKKLVNLSKSTYAEEISTDNGCGHVLRVVCDTGKGIRYVDIGESLVNCQQAQWVDVTAVCSKIAIENNVSPKVASSVEEKKDSVTPKSRLVYSLLTHVLLGKTLRVTKGQIISPKEFFMCVQDLYDSYQYNTLAKKLEKNKIPLLSDPPEHSSLYIGMPCKIQQNNRWCRCALMEHTDLNNVTLCLVDFGKIVKMNIVDVFAIDSELVSSMPPAAIRCTLNGLVKPFSYEWNSEATQALQLFFDNSYSLFCTVRCYAGDCSGLYFICSIKSDGDTADEYLLKAGVARRCGSISDLPPSMQLNSFDVSSASSVSVGKEYSLQVTHVCKDNGMFYCQRSTSLLIVEAIMKNLQMAVMQTPADNIYSEIVKRGLICAVRYQDGLWYRAHLLENFPKNSSSEINVLLVDYGIEYLTTRNDIKFGIANKLVDIPIQAFRCCLSDVQPGELSEKSRQMVSDDLTNTISQKLLRGTVVGRDDDCILLDLYQDGKRVNERLVSLCGPKTTPCVGSHAPDLSVMRFRIELKETVPLEKGDEHDVFLSDSVNPHEFYLLLDEFERQRKEFIRVLDGNYNAFRHIDYAVKKMYENELVCVNRNGTWCRAMILRVLKDTLALVQDLDSGSIFSAEICDMKQLLKPLAAKCPRFAVKCALVGVLPTKNGQWSEEAKEKFKKSNQHILLRVTFIDYDPHKGIWSVELCKSNGDSCAEALVKESLASLAEEKCVTAAPQPKELESISYGTHETITSQLKLIKEEPEEETVVNVSVKDTSFKESELKPFIKEEPQEKVCITTREMNFKEPPQVYISFVESNSCLYVQLVSEYESLMTMMTEVNAEEVTKSLSQMSKLEVGDACLSVYPEDGMYYRGKILEIKDAGEMNIFYVDYGNTSTVPPMSLYRLPENYVYPEFAIKCVLSDDSNVKENVPNMVEELGHLSAAEDIKIFADFTSDAKLGADLVRLSIEQDGATLSLDDYLSKKLNLFSGLEPCEKIKDVAEKETSGTDMNKSTASSSFSYKDAYDMHKSTLKVTTLKSVPSSGVKTTASLPDVGVLNTAPLKVAASKSVEAFTTPEEITTDKRSEEDLIKSFKPTLDILTKAALTSPFNPEKFTVIPLDRFYEKVLVEISELCKNEVARSNRSKSIAKFDYCITKHECLKATKPSYHRAEVTAIHPSDSMVSVRFIDCGHLGKVPQKNVKVITNAALLSFPSMSVQCQLENWEAFSSQIGYLKALQKVLSVYPMQVIFTGRKTGNSWVVQLLFDEWVICKLVISTNAPLLPIPEIPEKEPVSKIKICKDAGAQTNEVKESNEVFLDIGLSVKPDTIALPDSFIPPSVSTPNLPQSAAVESGQADAQDLSGSGDAPDNAQTVAKKVVCGDSPADECYEDVTQTSSVDYASIYTGKRCSSSSTDGAKSSNYCLNHQISSVVRSSLTESEKKCMKTAASCPLTVYLDRTESSPLPSTDEVEVFSSYYNAPIP